MKLELRSRGFYESIVFSPKPECLMQNQIYMLEMLLEILDRLDWRAKVKDPIVDRGQKPEIKVYKELPVVDGRGIDDEPETVVRIDRSNKATATGESDFEKQKKKISDRARQAIEEEPL